MVCVANSIIDPVKAVWTTRVACLLLSIYPLIVIATQFYELWSTFTTLKILVVKNFLKVCASL